VTYWLHEENPAITDWVLFTSKKKLAITWSVVSKIEMIVYASTDYACIHSDSIKLQYNVLHYSAIRNLWRNKSSRHRLNESVPSLQTKSI